MPVLGSKRSWLKNLPKTKEEASGWFNILPKTKEEAETSVFGQSTTKFKAGKYQPAFQPNTYVFQRPETEMVGTGGQTTRRLLTSSLQEAQRRARLTGRSLSAAETEGLTSAFFRQAGERLATRRALALQERGQDISAGLGYAGLTSTERMKGVDLEVAMKQLRSAEKMFKAGLISQEQLQRERMRVDKEIAQISAREQRRASESSGGLFGGGGFLGLGI